MTIAAVNGLALGGGCELAMACDVRIAAESAMFGQPEINLGIIPGFGGTQRLPRLVGEGRACELNLTGDPIGAEEAYAVGLANRVVPDEELFDTALAWARKLGGQAPLAVEQIKQVSAAGRHRDRDRAREAGASRTCSPPRTPARASPRSSRSEGPVRGQVTGPARFESAAAGSESAAGRLARLIEQADTVVALTGAGISVPSGIPDFRSPGTGLWAKVNPMEVAHIDAFRRDPVSFWSFYAQRFQTLDDKAAQPGPCGAGRARARRAARRGDHAEHRSAARPGRDGEPDRGARVDLAFVVSRLRSTV